MAVSNKVSAPRLGGKPRLTLLSSFDALLSPETSDEGIIDVKEVSKKKKSQSVSLPFDIDRQQNFSENASGKRQKFLRSARSSGRSQEMAAMRQSVGGPYNVLPQYNPHDTRTSFAVSLCLKRKNMLPSELIPPPLPKLDPSILELCDVIMEDNKLQNWKRWMGIRKEFQEKVKNKLKRKPKEMLMNKGDNYRKKIEDVMKIRYAQIAEPDKQRGCPGFWKMPQELKRRCRPSLFGVLRKEDLCQVPSLEIIGHSKKIMEEKGLEVSDEEEEIMKDMWESSKYRQEKEKLLKVKLKKIQSHKPDFDHLLVDGQNYETLQKINELSRSKETVSDKCSEETGGTKEEEIYYAISIEDNIEISSQNEEPRIEKYYYVIDYLIPDDEIVKGKITIKNIGHTVVKYMWKRLLPEKHLDILPKRKPSITFCFKKTEETLLMDQTVDMEIFFSTKQSGFYEETWELLITTVFTEKIRFILVLWAFAEESNYKNMKKQISTRLDEGVQNRIIDDTMVNLLYRVHIKTPEKQTHYPPLDISDKNIFEALNIEINKKPLQPSIYYYDQHIINEIKELYTEIRSVNDSPEWSLRVSDIDNIIQKLDNANDRISYKQQLDKMLDRLFRTDTVKNMRRDIHAHVYYLLCGMFDQLTFRIQHIRQKFNVKIKETYPKVTVETIEAECAKMPLHFTHYFKDQCKRWHPKNVLGFTCEPPLPGLKDLPYDDAKLFYKVYQKEKYNIDIPDDDAKEEKKGKKGKGKGKKGKKEKKGKKDKKGKKEKKGKKKDKSPGSSPKRKVYVAPIDYTADELSYSLLLSEEESKTSSSSESEDELSEDSLQMYNYNLYMTIFEILGNVVDDIVYAIETFRDKSVPHLLLKKLLEEDLSEWQVQYHPNQRMFDTDITEENESMTTVNTRVTRIHSTDSFSLCPSANTGDMTIKREFVDVFTETSDGELYPPKIRDDEVQTMETEDIPKDYLVDKIELNPSATSVHSLVTPCREEPPWTIFDEIMTDFWGA